MSTTNGSAKPTKLALSLAKQVLKEAGAARADVGLLEARLNRIEARVNEWMERLTDPVPGHEPRHQAAYLSIAETAAWLNVSEFHVNQLIKEGLIKRYDFRADGASVALPRIRREDIEAFTRAREVSA